MKRAEAKIIGASFFQFYKTAYHINYINAVKYLLYGILRDQGLLISGINRNESTPIAFFSINSFSILNPNLFF